MSENAGEAGAAGAETLSNEPIIRIEGMNKWFGQFHVLRDIDLTVYRGERIVICGPSGSGKSTLIRCINRLEEHQKGAIVVEGIELTGDLKQVENVRREVGMLFQQFNLFPHLSRCSRTAPSPPSGCARRPGRRPKKSRWNTSPASRFPSRP